jgi:hypothetical protein
MFWKVSLSLLLVKCYCVARSNTKSACTGVVTFLSPRHKSSSNFWRMNKKCRSTCWQIWQDFVSRWEITDVCSLDSHWDPYWVSITNHRAFSLHSHIHYRWPKFPPFCDKNILLSWTHIGTHMASPESPIQPLSLRLNRPLSWTQIPTSFGPKLSLLLDSHWDQYWVFCRTQTASCLEPRQPLTFGPTQPSLCRVHWSRDISVLQRQAVF